MKNYKILNRDNLLRNLHKFKGKEVCAMVKSDAYGHGQKEIVSILNDQVDYFGVVSVEEGKILRKYTDKPVLVASKTFDYKSCKRFSLEFMVDDLDDLQKCVKEDVKDFCHLKINCGMNRFGVKSDLNAKFINDFLQENNINLKSIYTHFPDTTNFDKTVKSYQNFLKISAEISQDTKICFGGSGLINYPFQYDMLRVGIGLYGYGRSDLLPVMQIKSYVLKVFFAKKGEFIGYGRKYKVKKDGFFAIIPVGYGDGLRRNLSGKFVVEIDGKIYKSVGNICMDAFFVRIDASIKVGMSVVVMSDAQYLAEKSGTISYEILTGFSSFRGETKIV